MANEKELVIKITSKDLTAAGFSSAQKKFGALHGVAGKALTAIKIGAAAAAGALTASAWAAVDFESAFAGVRKTVNASEAEFGQLESNIRDIAKSSPASASSLAQIGEMAGQLGVSGVDNLTTFIDTISKISVTTNLTQEEAASSFAQIANVMSEPLENIGRMASTVVELGNNFATTEADITMFAQRLSGAGKIAGFTTSDIFGIAAAMSSVGINAEAGGTAVSTVMKGITKEVITGGEKLRQFADVAGMSSGQFADLWRSDASAGFEAFVKGLGAQGEDAILTLEDLELTDSRLQGAFLSLAGAGDLVTRAIASGTAGFEENNALTAEAEKRYKTTASQIAILKNNFMDIAITVGSYLLPPLTDMLQKVTKEIGPAFQKLSAWVGQNLVPKFLQLRDAAVQLGQWFSENMVPRLRALGDAAIQLWEDIAPLRELLAMLLTKYIIPLVLQGLLVMVDALTKVIKGISSFIEFLEKVGEKINDITETISEAFGDLTEWVEEQVDAMVAAWEAFADKVGDVARDVADVFRGMADAAKRHLDNIARFFEATKTKVKNTITAMGNLTANDVATWLEGLERRIYDYVSDSTEAFILWGESVVDSIKKAASNALKAVGQWFTDMYKKVSSGLDDSFKRIGSWVTDTGNRLKNGYNNFLIGVSDWMTRMGKLISNGLNSLPQRFTDFVNSAWQRVTNGFNNILNGIKNWFNSLGNNTKGNTDNAGSQVANNVTAAAENTIKSPSAIMRIARAMAAIFIAIPALLAVGLADIGWQVASKVMDAIVSGLRNLGWRIKQGIEDAFNWAVSQIRLPTIQMPSIEWPWQGSSGGSVPSSSWWTGGAIPAAMAGGGFVSPYGQKPVPIIAHEGEVVLNPKIPEQRAILEGGFGGGGGANITVNFYNNDFTGSRSAEEKGQQLVDYLSRQRELWQRRAQ